MAVLKDLIVHGPSRFLNKAYFDSINADSIEANKGIFNKLIAKDSTLTNATVVGLLDVSGELHTNSWTNSNIATIDGSFYITPTIESDSGTAAVTATTLSFTGGNYAVTSLYTSNDSGVTTYTSWASGSKVLVTGEILVNGEYIPLGSLIGVLDGAATTSSIKVKNITDNHGNASATLTAIGNISGAAYRKLKVSLYQRANGSTMYPLGIYMTALGDNGRTFIDIYGGGNATSTAAGGGMAKPVLRIGNLQGLPAFSLPNNTSVSPTGWGIYTNNGFFSGTIVSTQGKIGNFTLGTAIYSGTNSMNSNATGIYLGTDGIRNYNTADKYVNIKDGIITAKGANINGEITASKLTINSNATINDTSGLISNSAVEVGGRNLVWDTEWKNIPTRWTDWGTPTTREIVTLNGKQWLHLVTTANSYQGYSQNWTKRENSASEIQAGDTVVFSYTAYAETAGQVCTVGCHWNNSSGSIVNQSWFASSLTTTPKRYTSQPFTVPANAVKFNVMIGQGVAQAQNLYISEVKIEKGNKATDWTPAPEDVDNTINSSVDAVGEDLSDFQKDFDKRLLDYDDALYNEETGIDKRLQDLGKGLEEAKEQFALLANSINGYMAFGDTSDPNQVALTLGAKSSPYKVRLTNSELQFLDGNTTSMAYMNNESLFVQNSLSFGKFMFYQRGTHFTLKYTGGNN